MASLLQFNKNLLNKSLILLLLISGSFTLLAADKHIDLKVYLDGTDYKIEFKNSECPTEPNELGCVEAEQGNSPIITWELDSESNEKWKLTHLQFSPDGQNWGVSGHPLKDCTMESFDLSGNDRDTGDASTAQVISNGRRLHIHDFNKKECLTHYKLFAESQDGGDEINSDPIIRDNGN